MLKNLSISSVIACKVNVFINHNNWPSEAMVARQASESPKFFKLKESSSLPKFKQQKCPIE